MDNLDSKQFNIYSLNTIACQNSTLSTLFKKCYRRANEICIFMLTYLTVCACIHQSLKDLLVVLDKLMLVLWK